jgi:hypothetical protein
VFGLRKWRYLDVVIIMHRKAINQMAIRMSQDKPGSRQYLGVYKRACGKIKQKFSESQCQIYRAMAKEWTEKKLPPKLQQQYVHCNDSSRFELTDCFILA